MPRDVRNGWAEHPGHGNDERAPLLFISGSSDHLMLPSIQRSNAKHYESDTASEVKEFEGPHLLPAWPGWEQVADYALDWALRHARQSVATLARDIRPAVSPQRLLLSMPSGSFGQLGQKCG